MGISIKREETERLARRLARLKDESLTDAIHHALEGELARLDQARKSPLQVEKELVGLFAKLDALGYGNGKSLEEIETEMYGDHGELV